MDQSSNQIELIKRLTIIALFADDDMLERLVLKGGNAIALAYGINTRVSSDVDLSMSGSFEVHELPEILERFRLNLAKTFKEKGWIPFDITLEEKPPELTEDMADFWGGYKLRFKILDIETYRQYENDMEQLRRLATVTGLNQRKNFEVDISRHEYCEAKQVVTIDDYEVFVYTPTLLVCEKIRAICQQMPEYDPIVKRNRGNTRSSRPRDFLDIHTIMTCIGPVDMKSISARELLEHVFHAKKVPLKLLDLVKHTYDQHVVEWSAVEDTVNLDFELEKFQYYFDFVVELIKNLHPGRNV